MNKSNFIYHPASLFLILVSLLVVVVTRADIVYAGSLSSLSDTQSSIKVNTLSDHTIQFVTPTGIAAAEYSDS
jgi:hypothetical protein